MIISLAQSIECSIKEFNELLEFCYSTNVKIGKKPYNVNLSQKSPIGVSLCCEKSIRAYIYKANTSNSALVYLAMRYLTKRKNGKTSWSYMLFNTNLDGSIADGTIFKKDSILTSIRKFSKRFNSLDKNSNDRPLANYIDEQNLIDLKLNYVDPDTNKVVTYVNNAGILLNNTGDFPNIVEYDLKSAWLTFLAQDKLPYVPVYQELIRDENKNILFDKDGNPLYINKLDTYKCYYPSGKKVEKNQIGFRLKTDLISTNYDVVEEGKKAHYIFDLVENKQQKELLAFKDDIQNTKDKLERRNKKNMCNIRLGNLVHKNPFLRSYVIHCCNNYIMNLINKYKEYFIYSVTDSLGFTKNIEELDENTEMFTKKERDICVYLRKSNRLYYDKTTKRVVDAANRGISKAKLIGTSIDEAKNQILNDLDYDIQYDSSTKQYMIGKTTDIGKYIEHCN